MNIKVVILEKNKETEAILLIIGEQTTITFDDKIKLYLKKIQSIYPFEFSENELQNLTMKVLENGFFNSFLFMDHLKNNYDFRKTNYINEEFLNLFKEIDHVANSYHEIESEKSIYSPSTYDLCSFGLSSENNKVGNNKFDFNTVKFEDFDDKEEQIKDYFNCRNKLLQNF